MPRARGAWRRVGHGAVCHPGTTDWGRGRDCERSSDRLRRSSSPRRLVRLGPLVRWLQALHFRGRRQASSEPVGRALAHDERRLDPAGCLRFFAGRLRRHAKNQKAERLSAVARRYRCYCETDLASTSFNFSEREATPRLSPHISKSPLQEDDGGQLGRGRRQSIDLATRSTPLRGPGPAIAQRLGRSFGALVHGRRALGCACNWPHFSDRHAAMGFESGAGLATDRAAIGADGAIGCERHALGHRLLRRWQDLHGKWSRH